MSILKCFIFGHSSIRRIQTIPDQPAIGLISSAPKIPTRDGEVLTQTGNSKIKISNL